MLQGSSERCTSKHKDGRLDGQATPCRCENTRSSISPSAASRRSTRPTPGPNHYNTNHRLGSIVHFQKSRLDVLRQIEHRKHAVTYMAFAHQTCVQHWIFKLEKRMKLSCFVTAIISEAFCFICKHSMSVVTKQNVHPIISTDCPSNSL